MSFRVTLDGTLIVVLYVGGEDCKVRVWSIKSGEMLFEEKLTSSAPVAVCWQGSAGNIFFSPYFFSIMQQS